MMMRPQLRNGRRACGSRRAMQTARRWCLATRIAMGAATAGIELTSLEVLASSRSDARGLFGMADISGEPVGAGPRDVQLLVRIAAPGVSAEKLRTLVEDGHRCSPLSAAARDVVPVALRIEVGDA
jgi:hypothetical protein